MKILVNRTYNTLNHRAKKLDDIGEVCSIQVYAQTINDILIPVKDVNTIRSENKRKINLVK